MHCQARWWEENISIIGFREDQLHFVGESSRFCIRYIYCAVDRFAIAKWTKYILLGTFSKAIQISMYNKRRALERRSILHFSCIFLNCSLLLSRISYQTYYLCFFEKFRESFIPAIPIAYEHPVKKQQFFFVFTAHNCTIMPCMQFQLYVTLPLPMQSFFSPFHSYKHILLQNKQICIWTYRLSIHP